MVSTFSTQHTLSNLSPPLEYEKMAQAQDNDPAIQKLRTVPTSLKLQDCKLPNNDLTILCDVSTDTERVLIPPLSSVKSFFTYIIYHILVKKPQLSSSRNDFFGQGCVNKSLPGSNNANKLSRRKHFRHTKTAPGVFKIPYGRFSDVAIYLIGPLPTSNGYKYILTCIDRVPIILKSDGGPCFTNFAWAEIMRFLGIQHNLTTAYHPISNGFTERANAERAIKCSDEPERWFHKLDFIVLALRNRYLQDLKCTPAEFAFGNTLRLPGGFFSDSKLASAVPTSNYLGAYRDFINDLQFTPTKTQSLIYEIHTVLRSSGFETL
ncbi:uncharacterized protein LOC143459575 [Clavelina lepadiformis]|uniref:uncharacterized protein LOC143459575 n=1 Tax=Clavelina lepadiformis TaxID=159417 RepID=UPI004041003C